MLKKILTSVSVVLFLALTIVSTVFLVKEVPNYNKYGKNQNDQLYYVSGSYQVVDNKDGTANVSIEFVSRETKSYDIVFCLFFYKDKQGTKADIEPVVSYRNVTVNNITQIDGETYHSYKYETVLFGLPSQDKYQSYGYQVGIAQEELLEEISGETFVKLVGETNKEKEDYLEKYKTPIYSASTLMGNWQKAFSKAIMELWIMFGIGVFSLVTNVIVLICLFRDNKKHQ